MPTLRSFTRKNPSTSPLLSGLDSSPSSRKRRRLSAAVDSSPAVDGISPTAVTSNKDSSTPEFGNSRYPTRRRKSLRFSGQEMATAGNDESSDSEDEFFRSKRESRSSPIYESIIPALLSKTIELTDEERKLLNIGSSISPPAKTRSPRIAKPNEEEEKEEEVSIAVVDSTMSEIKMGSNVADLKAVTENLDGKRNEIDSTDGNSKSRKRKDRGPVSCRRSERLASKRCSLGPSTEETPQVQDIHSDQEETDVVHGDREETDAQDDVCIVDPTMYFTVCGTKVVEGPAMEDEGGDSKGGSVDEYGRVEESGQFCVGESSSRGVQEKGKGIMKEKYDPYKEDCVLNLCTRSQDRYEFTVKEGEQMPTHVDRPAIVQTSSSAMELDRDETFRKSIDKISEVRENPMPEQWPGPYSTAMELVRKRGEKLEKRRQKIEKGENLGFVSGIEWEPSRKTRDSPRYSSPPLLTELSMKMLVDNFGAVESLGQIGDEFTAKISSHLCASRKMDPQAVDVILSACDTIIEIPDCSHVPEEELEQAFARRGSLSDVKVLHLDLAGRSISYRFFQNVLFSPTSRLSLLQSISLKGAYRLNDDCLTTIASGLKSLKFINLSHCTAISEVGIDSLAQLIGWSLKELNLEGCVQLNAMVMLPSLLKMTNLEVLSLSGMESVCDEFISCIVSNTGPKMKSLMLQNCQALTDKSVEAIAKRCPGLCTLDLRHLNKLTDSAVAFLASGCRSIQNFSIDRCPFSDDAISAFLEASDHSLVTLSLNGVEQVSDNTAQAIAGCCSGTLISLDVSWCRKMGDEALGLIADSCKSLRLMKLFGCTQVTEKFLDGHSNSQLEIVGFRNSCLIPYLSTKHRDF